MDSEMDDFPFAKVHIKIKPKTLILDLMKWQTASTWRILERCSEGNCDSSEYQNMGVSWKEEQHKYYSMDMSF